MKTIFTSPNKPVKALSLALVALLFVSGVSAQTVANWNLNGTLSGTAAANSTASAVALGSSIPSGAFNGGTEYYGQDGWPSGAIDPNAYIQFSASPNTGYYLVLNTVTMVIRRSNTGTPHGAGPNNWTLRSSLDGYTSDLGSSGQTDSYVTYTVTLPAAFQTLASTVTFRLYGYNTTINSGGNSRLVADNVSIQGQEISGGLASQSLELTAKASARAVRLQWQAQGMADGTLYSIQRSADGISFTTIGEQTGTDYQFEDENTPAVAKLFYRVQAQQPDGESLYSAVAVVATQAAVSTGNSIRSVAAQGGLVRSVLHIGEAGSYQLIIWSSEGKALYRQLISGPAGDQVATITAGNYPHGVYILTLSKDNVNISRQFMY